MSADDRSKKELLSELLRVQRNQIRGIPGADEALRSLYQKVLDRMQSNEPVKTEKKTFGELDLGEEFLAPDGSRNLFVIGGGNYAALPLDGPSKNILWWPGAQYVVEKIIG